MLSSSSTHIHTHTHSAHNAIGAIYQTQPVNVVVGAIHYNFIAKGETGNREGINWYSNWNQVTTEPHGGGDEKRKKMAPKIRNSVQKVQK